MALQQKSRVTAATAPGTASKKGSAETIRQVGRESASSASQESAERFQRFQLEVDAALGVSTFDPARLEADPGHLEDLEDLTRCHALIATAAQTPAIGHVLVRLLAARLWSAMVVPLGKPPACEHVALVLHLSGRGSVATAMQDQNLIDLDTLLEALNLSGRAHRCGLTLAGALLIDEADRKIHLIGTARAQQEVARG